MLTYEVIAVELKPLDSKKDFQAVIMLTSVKPFSLGNRAVIYQFVLKRVWKKREATIERLLASFHRIKLRDLSDRNLLSGAKLGQLVHFGIDLNKGDIVIKQRGIYLLIVCPQIGKVSGTTPRWLDFWVRVNNIDVSNSNIRTVLMDPQEKTVVPLNVVLPLDSDDTLNIMMATETMDEGLGVEAITPIGEPTIASIILTIVHWIELVPRFLCDFQLLPILD